MLLLWGALGIFAFSLASGGATAWWVQGLRLTAAKNEHKAFVAQTKAIGDVAEIKARQKDADLKRLKETVDHETKLNNSKLDDAARRLRDVNTRRSFVPTTSADSKRPDLACFDRTDFDTATRELARSVSEITIEGEQATIGLDSAKVWADGLKKNDAPN